VDIDGIVFVTDTQNNVIKEIEPGCVSASCTTEFNIVFNRPQGIALDASDEYYVADTFDNAVKWIPPSCHSLSCVRTVGSGFHTPTAVAVDANGNVFVADSGNNAVKEVLASGGYATVLTLGSGFSYPDGIAIDHSGNLFVADQGHNAVKELLKTNGYSTVETVVSDITTPLSLAVDGSGNLFVGADGETGVQEILAAGGYKTIIPLGNGFHKSLGVAVDGRGNVFAADYDNSRVLELETASADFMTVAIGQSSAAIPLTFTFDSSGTIGTPLVLTQGVPGLDFADAGTGTCNVQGSTHVYAAGDTCTVNVTFAPRFAGQRDGAVRLRDKSGNTIATGYVQGTGSGPQVGFLPGTESILGSGSTQSYGVAVDGSGNVFIAGNLNNTVKEIPSGCVAISCIKTLGSGFNAPWGVAVDGSGNLFVSDQGHNAVKEILAATGYVTAKTLGGGFNTPSGIALDGSGNVFVADTLNNVVKEVPPGCVSASCVKTLGGRFNGPIGIAVDGIGNVFVADQDRTAVKEILALGGYVTVNTLATEFNLPWGIAVDGVGNLFVADTDNNEVKELLAGYNYTVVKTVGSGFISPASVAVDSRGNVFVADLGNQRVVKLDYADPPTASFPTPTPVGSTDTNDGPRTVAIQNIGNFVLVFQPFSAANLLDAVLETSESTSCTGLNSLLLEPSSSCTVSFEFQPAHVGAVTGHVNIVDNALTGPGSGYATQTITFQGTGTLGMQTITFSLPSQATLNVPITLSATGGGSGNPVVFTVVSGPGRISGNTLTVTAIGTVTIAANQAGNANYAAAPTVQRTTTVSNLCARTIVPGGVHNELCAQIR
jgi:streptogramin lyase